MVISYRPINDPPAGLWFRDCAQYRRDRCRGPTFDWRRQSWCGLQGHWSELANRV